MTMIKISEITKFLVEQIILGKVTYLEIVTHRIDLKEQIDIYIKQEQLEIDKTV